MFLRVNLVTGVGRALKSKKLTPCFIGPYQIIERIGEVVMTGHLTLLLACFSVVFSRFYQQNRGVLDQLPMI